MGIDTVNVGRIDLNLLVHLDALLKERSVTRAAARVGIGQSAMSHNLARLRRRTSHARVRGHAPDPTCSHVA
jgi:regulatory helix-turn-helix LysR family protein